MAKDNKQLGLFKLDGIEPAPRGIPQIEVSFDIDVNGIVNVKAKDMKTNKEQSITIQNSTGLSEEEIDRMVKEAESNKADDEKKRKDIETKNKAEAMINQIDKALAEQGANLPEDQKNQATALRDELKTALDNNDMATLESKMSELEQIAQQMVCCSVSANRMLVIQQVQTLHLTTITMISLMQTLLKRTNKKAKGNPLAYIK